jgi:hypothetical protein
VELRAKRALALIALLLAAAPASAAADVRRPASQTEPPAFYSRSAVDAIAIARGVEEVRDQRRKRPALMPVAYVEPGRRWQVSWYADGRERVQVHLRDWDGRVVEVWTGHQVAWRMARGYDGAFGRKVSAPYVWLPLCLVFLLPFVHPRRPFRLLHLDLLVLLLFGVSHIWFNRGEIGVSVPLAYPVLAYLLVRMLVAGFRRRDRGDPLVPLVPVTWLAVGLLFLAGFRIGLNVTDSNVIDVGYASVVGADRIADGDSLYEGEFPRDLRNGDTYGPVTYLAYLPFEQALRWSGAWDDLPPAHAAAIAFDLLTMLGLLVLGWRLRPGSGRGWRSEGTALGLALAFAWAAFPYTLFTMNSGANDTLVAMLVTWALVALSSPAARGALLALGAAAKFAPLALAPLFATAGPRRLRGAIGFSTVLAVVLAATFLPFLPEGGVREVYDRTVGYQAGRESPFSVWGLEPGLDWLQTAITVGAVGLALLVAFVPRRKDAVQVAALGAAVILAVQLAMEHWFYLYIVWFLPLALVALFAVHGRPKPAPPARATEPAGEPAPVAA